MPATSETRRLVACPESLTAVHLALEQFWVGVAHRLGMEVPLRTRFALTTAVSEVAANIIRYAKIDAFALSLVDDGEGGLLALLDDAGVPYEPRGLPAGNVLDLAEGGFGLALAGRVVDELSYKRGEDGMNHWRLRVQLPSAPPRS